jgi:hypothetical protein
LRIKEQEKRLTLNEHDDDDDDDDKIVVSDEVYILSHFNITVVKIIILMHYKK